MTGPRPVGRWAPEVAELGRCCPTRKSCRSTPSTRPEIDHAWPARSRARILRAHRVGAWGTVSGGVLGTGQSWAALTAWLRADGVRDVLVDRAHRLSTYCLRHLCDAVQPNHRGDLARGGAQGLRVHHD
jgi:hypothetical protein